MKHSIIMVMFAFVWGIYSQAIYNTFGNEGRLANAVAYAESSMNAYAQNWNGEASIGLFQINLNAWSYYVPGNSWSEKVAYLENPYNNIDMAYKIRWCYYGTCSGWNQWGAYSSGRAWQFY